jgi:hypothetical protein
VPEETERQYLPQPDDADSGHEAEDEEKEGSVMENRQ